MGNSQSSSTERLRSKKNEREQQNGAITHPNDAAISVRPPAKPDDQGSVSNRAQRRRSMLSIPSFRRKPSILAEGANTSSSNDTLPTTPSRRGWKRFSSLKPRPVSSIAASSSLLPDTDLQNTPDLVPESDPPVRIESKGKEREHGSAEIVAENEDPADYVMMEESSSQSREVTSSELLGELRNLQNAQEKGEDEAGTSKSSERPPTPIPSTANEEDRYNSSRAQLAENLGSWLGRGRAPSEERALSSSPLLNASNTQCSEPSSVTSPRIGSRSQSLPNIPRSASEPTNGNEQERPALDSALDSPTGTIVIVQGIVHTSETAQRPSLVPPRPSPRPAPSAPSLRPPRNRSSSRPSSRPSTPQSSGSRSRLSALADTIRHRSRPSSSAGSPLRSGTLSLNPWPRGQSNESQSETESDRSLGLGVPSDSDVTSSSVVTDTSSSVAAVVSTDNMPSPVPSSTEPGTERGPIPAIEVEGPTEASANPTEGHSRSPNDESGSEDDNETELSASSIEVLGTLLSVATAATAASLMSGSTEPLFSSGLAARSEGPESMEAHGSPPSTPGSDGRPARLRNAWGNLRDRFSRSRSRRSSTSDRPREDNDATEAQLMRQMAQALNLDLGSPSETQPEERWTPDDSSAEPLSSDAPSGAGDEERPDRRAASDASFNRFLRNLQDDLRNALVADYAARRARVRVPAGSGESAVQDLVGGPEAASNMDESPSAPATEMHSAELPSSSLADVEEAVPAPSVNEDSDETLQLSPNSSEDPVASSSAGPTQPSSQPLGSDPVPQPTPRLAHLDLPPLRGSVPQPGASPSQPQQARAVTGQPGAGINWWRLYRFPPMVVNSSQQQQQSGSDSATLATAGVPPSMNPDLVGTVSSATASAPSTDDRATATQEATPTDSAPTTQSEQSASGQPVVPVIVVGLRSVPMRLAESNDAASPLSPPLFPEPQEPSEEPQDRGRPWPLRAASRAFNRIGRRGEGENATASIAAAEEGESQASGPHVRTPGRTYLIFVIGGYYPPNHSLVTGADDMDSFEALLELAELLGQVKPPVASKEDIEKSGLPVFKASELTEQEKAGKVASNTVDNCLICLEPYEPEDNLRLLKCRHAYHQDCIDKWLEQGRNNCPVCRTLGAETSSDAPTSPLSSPDA